LKRRNRHDLAKTAEEGIFNQHNEVPEENNASAVEETPNQVEVGDKNTSLNEPPDAVPELSFTHGEL
jgi:hypothetical protein